MASLLHIAVGAAAGRFFARRPSWRASIGFGLLSMLPDADVVMFSLGYPYHHPLGHRGATHSICFAVVCRLLALRPTRESIRTAVLVTLVVLSHPLLDALTNGGLGVGLGWPITNERYFAPWRPIPVAPIGWDFLSRSGLRVAIAELAPSIPLLAYAVWPKRRR